MQIGETLLGFCQLLLNNCTIDVLLCVLFGIIALSLGDGGKEFIYDATCLGASFMPLRYRV